MELNRNDLMYFVRYVLLDATSRPPSGKRQTKTMKGFWMGRPGKVKMRGSDRRMRRSLCVHSFLTVGGMSVGEAAIEVAGMLGRGTADQVDVIRVEYYKCGGKKLDLGHFPSQFFHWRASMFRCSDEVLGLILGDYEKFFDESMRRRLEDLIQAIRADSAQKARNREWLLEPGGPARTRIESYYCLTPLEEHWHDLATDLWSLGRLHAGIGETQEAKILFERALDIWKSHGHILPHVQAEAIPALEGELSRLSL